MTPALIFNNSRLLFCLKRSRDTENPALAAEVVKTEEATVSALASPGGKSLLSDLSSSKNEFANFVRELLKLSRCDLL